MVLTSGFWASGYLLWPPNLLTASCRHGRRLLVIRSFMNSVICCSKLHWLPLARFPRLLLGSNLHFFVLRNQTRTKVLFSTTQLKRHAVNDGRVDLIAGPVAPAVLCVD